MANKSMRLTRTEIDNIPHKWLEVIIHFLMGFRNDTVDFSRPHLRRSVAQIYPLFVVLYAILVIFGTVANLAVIWNVAKQKLHKDPTYSYMVNLAVANLVKCVLVLPISLTILLVQNWIFGSFLCFFLPMLQDIPLHVSMMTYLLIAVDRYRLMLDPRKPRLPPFACITGTWLLSVCIVLPYPIYTTYLDLGSYMQTQFKGVGICAVNLVDDMQEYMRWLFIIMYVLPLAVMSYLFVRISRELKVAEGPLAVIMYQARSRTAQACQDSTDEDQMECRITNNTIPRPSSSFDLYEAEVDVNKEKRTQKYLISMVTTFAICLCPLMVLRLAKLALTETYENSGHFDIIFIMFVWIAFIPTCTTPCIFALWRMSRTAKQHLGRYFCLNSRVTSEPAERRTGAITGTPTDYVTSPSPFTTQDAVLHCYQRGLPVTSCYVTDYNLTQNDGHKMVY